MRLHLSDLAIRKLKPPLQGQAKYRDTVLPGFGIVVGQRTKTFFITVGEQRRNLTVGRYPDMNLAAARKAAIKLMDETPSKTRVERLPQLVSLFLADCTTRLRPSSVEAYRTVLRHAPDISVAKVSKMTVPVKTAHQIKSYKALFNWAVREEITDKNPYQHLTARYGQKDRVLDENEIRAIWEPTAQLPLRAHFNRFCNMHQFLRSADISHTSLATQKNLPGLGSRAFACSNGSDDALVCRAFDVRKN